MKGTCLYSIYYVFIASPLDWRKEEVFWKYLKYLQIFILFQNAVLRNLTMKAYIDKNSFPLGFWGYLWLEGHYDQLLSHCVGVGLQWTVHGYGMFTRSWCRGSTLCNGMKFFREDRLSVSLDRWNSCNVTKPHLLLKWTKLFEEVTWVFSYLSTWNIRENKSGFYSSKCKRAVGNTFIQANL